MTFSLNEYSGSPTIGTAEYSLPAATTSGVPTAQTASGFFQPHIDLNAMAAVDEFILQFYEKVVSGGTQRLGETFTFSGAQQKKWNTVPAIALGNGWDITLKKVSGTDRAIPFRITRIY